MQKVEFGTHFLKDECISCEDLKRLTYNKCTVKRCKGRGKTKNILIKLCKKTNVFENAEKCIKNLQNEMKLKKK